MDRFQTVTVSSYRRTGVIGAENIYVWLKRYRL